MPLTAAEKQELDGLRETRGDKYVDDLERWLLQRRGETPEVDAEQAEPEPEAETEVERPRIAPAVDTPGVPPAVPVRSEVVPTPAAEAQIGDEEIPPQRPEDDFERGTSSIIETPERMLRRRYHPEGTYEDAPVGGPGSPHDEYLQEKLKQKATPPPQEPPPGVSTDLPFAESGPVTSRGVVAPVDTGEAERAFEAQKSNQRLIQERFEAIKKESPGISDAAARGEAVDDVARFRTVVQPGVDPAKIDKAFAEAIAAESLKIALRHRGDPEWDDKRIKNTARMRVLDAIDPRDVEGRRRIGGVTREDVESKSGWGALWAAMHPKIHKTEAQAEAEALTYKKWRDFRKEAFDAVEARVDPSVKGDARIDVANKALVLRVKEARKSFKTEEDWLIFASVIAPEAIPPEKREGWAGRLMRESMVTEDMKTGRVVETPLGQTVRNINVLVTLGLESINQALGYDIDEQGIPTDPMDPAYRIERTVEHLFGVPRKELVRRSPGGPLVWEVRKPGPTESTLPTTIGVLVPRPFQGTTRRLGAQGATDSGDYLKDVAVSLFEARGQMQEMADLPAYVETLESIGMGWYPYVFGAGTEIALPITGVFGPGFKALGAGLGVGAEVAAGAASAARKAAPVLRGLDVTDPLVKVAAAGLEGGAKVADVTSAGLHAASAPVRTAERISAVRQSRLATRGLVGDEPLDLKGVADANDVRQVTAEFISRETVGPAKAWLRLGAQVAENPKASIVEQDLIDMGGGGVFITGLAKKLADKAGQIDAGTAQRAIRSYLDDLGKSDNVLIGKAANLVGPVADTGTFNEVARRYANVTGAARELDDVDVAIAAGADIIAEKLLHELPGSDLVMLPGNVVIPRATWLDRGEEVVQTVRGAFKGKWTTPDSFHVADASPAAVSAANRVGGDVPDIIRIRDTLTAAEHRAVLDEVLSTEARKIGGQGLRTTGRAATEAVVPEARRAGAIKAASTLARGAGDAVALATPASIGRAVSSVRKWAAKKASGITARVDASKARHTPLASANAIDEIGQAAARIGDDIAGDLTALRKQGVTGPEAVQRMLDAHGAQEMADDDWINLVRSFFGREDISGDVIRDAGGVKGAHLTAETLADVIGRVRAHSPSQLTGVGVQTQTGGDHLFAALMGWLGQKKYERIVSVAIDKALKADPSLAPPKVNPRAVAHVAGVSVRQALEHNLPGSKALQGPAMDAVAAVAYKGDGNAAVAGLYAGVTKHGLFINDFADGATLDFVSKLFDSPEVTAAIDKLHEAVQSVVGANPKLAKELDRALAWSLIKAHVNAAEDGVAFWRILDDSTAADAMARAAPRFAAVGPEKVVMAFGEDIAKDIAEIQESVASGQMQAALERLMVSDPGLGDLAGRQVVLEWDMLRRVMIGGMLGGYPFPNMRFHGTNFLTAPAIVWTTSGPTAAMRATGAMITEAPPALARGAYETARRISPELMAKIDPLVDSGKRILTNMVGRSDDHVVFTDALGRPWTRAQLDAEMGKVDIQFSQATLEFDSFRMDELMRDAVVTPSMKRSGFMLQAARWWRPGGKTVWNIIGEESDNIFRRAVFAGALKDGATTGEAATLAQSAMLNYREVQAGLFGRKRLADAEQHVARQFILFWSFRRQMMLELARAALRRPSDVRRILLINKAVNQEAEKEGLMLPQYADARIGMWNTRYFDLVGRTQAGAANFGPQNPTVEAAGSLAAVANLIVSQTLGGLDAAEAWEGAKDVIFTPELELLGELNTYGPKEKNQGYLPPRHVAILQETGMWPWFREHFEIDRVDMDKRRAGQPTGPGGEQWEFGGDSYNDYLALMYGTVRLGLARNINDNIQFAYNAGLIGEGDRKRYAQDPAAAIGYLFSINTPMSAKTQAEAEIRAQQRVLQELVVMGATPD